MCLSNHHFVLDLGSVIVAEHVYLLAFVGRGPQDAKLIFSLSFR